MTLQDEFEIVRRGIRHLHREVCEGYGQTFDMPQEGVDALLALERIAAVPVSVTMPILSEEVCRPILEVGFDLGYEAASSDILKAMHPAQPPDWTPTENPFRAPPSTEPTS